MDRKHAVIFTMLLWEEYPFVVTPDGKEIFLLNEKGDGMICITGDFSEMTYPEIAAVAQKNTPQKTH